jgi:hypothetical protein
LAIFATPGSKPNELIGESRRLAFAQVIAAARLLRQFRLETVALYGEYLEGGDSCGWVGTMRILRDRCEPTGCVKKLLVPWFANLIVFLACTLALSIPILDSVGLRITSAVTSGWHLTYLTIGLVLVWLISVLLGCAREHEAAWLCFLDSIGVPAIVTALVYGAKTFS